MRIAKSTSLCMAAMLLGGCTTTKRVDIEISVTESLPKDVALTFLQELDRNGLYSCAFRENGMSGTPVFGSAQPAVTPYSTWQISNVAVTDSMMAVVVNKGEALSEFCHALENPREQGGEKLVGNDLKLIRKTITALVSLGVRYDKGKLSFFQ